MIKEFFRDILKTKSGYVIITSQNIYELRIDNAEQCCENWGYMITEEDCMEKFIGSQLLLIKVTDNFYNTELLQDVNKLTLCDGNGGIIFITFCTTVGDFQITLYNEHDGYYGHTVEILVNNITAFNDIL